MACRAVSRGTPSLARRSRGKRDGGKRPTVLLLLAFLRLGTLGWRIVVVVLVLVVIVLKVVLVVPLVGVLVLQRFAGEKVDRVWNDAVLEILADLIVELQTLLERVEVLVVDIVGLRGRPRRREGLSCARA